MKVKRKNAFAKALGIESWFFAEIQIAGGNTLKTSAENFEVGVDVSIVDATGNEVVAPDGEIPLETGETIIVKDGKIAEIKTGTASNETEQSAAKPVEQSKTVEVPVEKTNKIEMSEDKIKELIISGFAPILEKVTALEAKITMLSKDKEVLQSEVIKLGKNTSAVAIKQTSVNEFYTKKENVGLQGVFDYMKEINSNKEKTK